jgi:hypothetical protein
MAPERGGPQSDARRPSDPHQPARNPAMSSAGSHGRSGVGAPLGNPTGQSRRAGRSLHGVRAQASRRNGALRPQNALKHACARNAKAGLPPRPGRWRGRRHSQARTNPKIAAERTRAELEFERTSTARNPSEPRPLEGCPNPGAVEAKRTRGRVGAFMNSRSFDKTRLPPGRFAMPGPHAMIRWKS